MVGTRLYKIWGHMKGRCNNPNDSCYYKYGARGIKVCEEWNYFFEEFMDWALSHGYSDELSIDRKDNNGNYCPENCRWATIVEQNNNQRRTIWVEIDGIIDNIYGWSKRTGIAPGVLRWRYHNKGLRGTNLIRPLYERK